MDKIKMIGLDLDGTLLTDEKTVTDYTWDVLNKAMDMGVEIVIATGRPFSGIPKELRSCSRFRYMVTANGGRILDIKENKILYEKLVPFDKAVDILKVFEKYDTLREVYFDGYGYLNKDMLEEIYTYYLTGPMVEYISTTRIGVDDIWKKMEEKKGCGLDKVHGVFANTDEQAMALEELNNLGGLEITNALGNNLEVNPEGVDKGEGLIMLGKIIGIKPGEIMACGDGTNDLKMVQKVGLGVAMENAHEVVKKAANYITVSNEEDGVAKAIEKYVLTREG